MSENTMRLDEVMTLALQLSPLDKLRLIERLAPHLERDWIASTQPHSEHRSLHGLCADLGPAPSAEEIDQARREAWANFPREDIF
jgi:hypothetical protein